MNCVRCGYSGPSEPLDGECPECLMISLYQLDVMVKDQSGQLVWARHLAKRYREEMERYLRPEPRS